MGLKRIISNAKYRLIGRILVEDKQYRLVRKHLVLHAENYIQLENNGLKKNEDKATYNFIHVVDGDNRTLVRRHWKFYNRYKSRLIKR